MSRALLLTAVVCALAPSSAVGQAGPRPTDGLDFPELSFDPPTPAEHAVEGVPVFVLEDRALPLVTAYMRVEGGYSRFGREAYAAGMALSSLLRYGGTETLTPDSVDVLLEYYALQTSFGGSGSSITSTLNTLTEHLAAALDLWGDMLARPRFDADQVEIWRGRQLESIRRRLDDPSGLAFSEFNRLLYGDHPIGWEMEENDLVPERYSGAKMAELHAQTLCRENVVLGVTGDVDWDDVRPQFEALVAKIPPCAAELPPSPLPDIRREPGVYLIERTLEQAVIVMAHPTSVRLADDPGYFSATIGNSILGAGGFSSRILARVRTEEGYAYSASSLWTTPRRYDGLLGAITRTRPENTVPAIQAILQTMEGLRDAPPHREEVAVAVERIVNGFVFNFETSGQIVSRTMFYLAQELPRDWLQRYVRGVQEVTADGVHEAFASHLRPEEMMILVVGDPARIGRDALAELGPVTVLHVTGGS